MGRNMELKDVNEFDENGKANVLKGNKESEADYSLKDNPDSQEVERTRERAREYQELQEARKKRKRRIIIIAASVVAVLAVSTAVGIRIYQNNKVQAAAATEIVAEDGQEIVYAKITSIAGNDMEVSILKEAFDKRFPFGGDMPSKGDFDGERPEMPVDGEMPQMPSGDRPERPSGDFNPGDVPSRDKSSDGDSSEKGARSAMQFEETGETATFQIPVGTEVITKLGTTATFTSLSAGDVIALAVESGKDVIDKIWVVE